MAGKHTGEVWCGRKLCEGSIMWQENTQEKCGVAGNYAREA